MNLGWTDSPGDQAVRLHWGCETRSHPGSRRVGKINACVTFRPDHGIAGDRVGQDILASWTYANFPGTVGWHSTEACYRGAMDPGWRPRAIRCCRGAPARGGYHHLFGFFAFALRLASPNAISRAYGLLELASGVPLQEPSYAEGGHC
jgi:hypothetical protein